MTFSPSSYYRVHDSNGLSHRNEEPPRSLGSVRKIQGRNRNQRQSHHRTLPMHSPGKGSVQGPVTIPQTAGIPLPSYHIKRTESEVQLHEDMAMADYRDKCMFNRLVTGIYRQQQEQLHYDSQLHQFHRDRNPAQSDSQPLPSGGAQGQVEDQDSHRAGGNDVEGDYSSMITPIGSDGEETGILPRLNISVTKSKDQSSSPVADDWAIEGFDDEYPKSPVPPVTRVPSVRHQLRTSRMPVQSQLVAPPLESNRSSSHFITSSQSDQLFDMDL